MISSKRLLGLQTTLAVALLFLVAVQSSRVIDRHWGGRLRLGGPGSTGLKSSTTAYLEALRGRATLTYFVSSRREMPTHLKSVEDEVGRLLARVKSAAGEKIDIRRIDPDAPQDPGNVPPSEKVDSRAADSDSRRPPGHDYASAKSVSPIKVRKVLRDESSEVAVWSSLALAHDQSEDGLIQGITPGDLPYLEDLIVETLKACESTVQPVIAVAAPSRGYSAVREFAASLGGARVVSLDLDKDPRLPLNSDLLIWIEPASLGWEHAIELERYLATGRSVIVAGSTYSVDYLEREGGKFGYRAVRSSSDWARFLRRFGLGMKPLLTADKNREEITWHRDGNTIKLTAPFHIRVNPSLFDTRSLLGPNAGALLVSAVSPIAWDPKAVAASGRRLEVVATTSESALVMDLPDSEFNDASFEGALPVPKQPWMVLLRPVDPWKGDLLVVGSPILFHDDPYAQGGNANQTFLRTLLRTYTAKARLARIRVPRHVPPIVPELSLGARMAWRIFAVFSLPALLLVAALLRARSAPLGPRGVPWARRVVAGAATLVAVLLFSMALGGLGLGRVDMTEGSINTPSPLSERLIGGAREGLEVELLSSESFRMPPQLKSVEPRALGLLRRLGFRPRITRPEDLPAVEQQRLEASGATSFEVEHVVNDVTMSSRVWSAIRLSRGGKSEMIPRLDARSVDHLEFLLAFGVKRLTEGGAPVLGVLSDLPRLSPGEAHSDYQQKGYTAPVGSDVYSLAKQLLGSYGYRVQYINPETPVFPEKMDVLVWLQPRFPQRTWPQFTRFMAEGGKAVVAVQHYNIQQRQFRGAGFQTVYWPQPQFHGLNEYLKILGVQQVGDKQGEEAGEVLFDRQHADLTLETQVNRSAYREYNPQQVSLPFLIRASLDGLSANSVVTSRLGSLLFIWGSRFVVDDARLGSLGLSRQTLVSTSPRTWTYRWSGGWIPEKSFQEPENASSFLAGPQPLAMLLEGKFPRMDVKKDETGGREVLRVVDHPKLSQPQAPGKLLLIGCSEMFKSSYLEAEGYQHDQFLLNAVAFLAQGPELAEIQARRRAQKIFPYQSTESKLLLRLMVMGLPPVLFVLYALAHVLWRRKPILGKSAS